MEPNLEDKWMKMEQSFEWEEDPLVFIFHNEMPGKVKMMTHRLNMKDWIKIDKTYPGISYSRPAILYKRENKKSLY